MDSALKEAIRRSLKDVAASKAKAEEELKVAAVKEEPKATAPVEESVATAPVDEKETAAPVMEAEVCVADEPRGSGSFSIDAEGNGVVAVVLGATLDQCAEVIDAMMLEISRGSEETAASTEDEDAVEDAKESPSEANVEEADIVVETVSEADDASETHESVIEGAEGGATILESTENDDVAHEEEESVKSEQSEDEWQVVSDDEQMIGDEMLARAAQVIGSALFESGTSSLTAGASSSVLSSVPTISSESHIPAVLLDRWAPQLVQLRELGFADDAQSVDVLERLNAANIGVDSDDEITVERVVNELLKKD
jgi:hypothetical protein